MIPVVQLAHVKNYTTIFTAHETPIWKTRLWVNNYEKILGFMAETTNYNEHSTTVISVIIDFIEYRFVETYKELREEDCTWMLSEDLSLMMVHFKDHNSPFRKFSFKSGNVIGFSKGDPVQFKESKTLPILLSAPEIEDASDLFRYQKMKFDSGTVTIDNSSGILDDIWDLFGNDINLLAYTKERGLELIYQYYVEKYTIGLNTVTLSVKDKRSKLNFKCPNTTFEEHIFLDENTVGKVKQDAYGYCVGIPGVCINSKQLYRNEDDTGGFYDWFHYRFARTITSVEEIWVYNNKWVQVFPGLGVPDESTYQTSNPTLPCILKRNEYGDFVLEAITNLNKNNLPQNEGVIAIYWSQASGYTNYLDRRGGNVYSAKMSGVFVNKNTPSEIIKDMLDYYSNTPFTANYFDIEQFDKELSGQPNIGLFMNTSNNIYDWIEMIQNGGREGFQFLVQKNLFSVRLDNPNREETFDIKYIEIRNKESLSPEYSDENYASFTTINYLKDHTGNVSKTIVDDSFRDEVLDLYLSENEYEIDSLLINELDVRKKSRNILESSTQIKPIIRGIELEGLREDIQLFSTGYIDFTYQLPRQMKSIQSYMKARKFIGKMRVKVISCKRNIEQETLIIDVIQCDRLGVKIIKGGFANTSHSTWYPQTSATTSNFAQIIKGGKAIGY